MGAGSLRTFWNVWLFSLHFNNSAPTPSPKAPPCGQPLSPHLRKGWQRQPHRRTQAFWQPSGSPVLGLPSRAGEKVAPSPETLTFCWHLGSILSCFAATSASGSPQPVSPRFAPVSPQMPPATRVFLNPLLPSTPVPTLSSLSPNLAFFLALVTTWRRITSSWWRTCYL